MVLKTDRNLKLYYSIKEVSDIIGVNESTLRQYTERDIDLLRNIYTLVKVRGFKIAAARKMINENREGANKSTHVLNTLLAVRDDLRALKKELDGLV